MHDLTQKTRKKDIIFEGQILRVRKDEAEMPDGQIVEREVVEHPGGVGIALEDEDGKLYITDGIMDDFINMNNTANIQEIKTK